MSRNKGRYRARDRNSDAGRIGGTAAMGRRVCRPASARSPDWNWPSFESAGRSGPKRSGWRAPRPRASAL